MLTAHLGQNVDLGEEEVGSFRINLEVSSFESNIFRN